LTRRQQQQQQPTDPSASTREGQGHGHWLVWHTLACMLVRACWSAVQSAFPRLSVRLPRRACPVLSRFLSSQPGQEERAGACDAFLVHSCVWTACSAAMCLLASVLPAACFVPVPPPAAHCCCCFLLARAPHRTADTDCLSLCIFRPSACLSACAPAADPCCPLRRRLSGSVCVACARLVLGLPVARAVPATNSLNMSTKTEACTAASCNA
jgi:hypothetical protein